MDRPFVFVGRERAAYFSKIRKAADGAGEKEGGLNKERVGHVMRWAHQKGIIGTKALWCGKAGAVRLRSSAQLRRSLKRNIEQIIYRLSCDEQ